MSKADLFDRIDENEPHLKEIARDLWDHPELGLHEERSAERLIEALEDGRIRAAGLDVLPEEPPTDDRLIGRDDTLITPHSGWYSEESQREVRRRAAEEVRRALAEEPPDSPVDPEWL